MLGHGKRTKIEVETNDLSIWVKNSEMTQGADEHDTTGYGVDDHEFGEDGLGTGEFSMDGLYFSGVTGPRAILKPLRGKLATIERMPEGAGIGKPLETFQVFIGEYKETNPFAGYITWAIKCKVSGPVVETAQE